ncbi:MAG: hypothetical protein EZS28_021155 [Streblomastix strix]|uniref:Uncharacterized protein n=1 Tax=Streblomastix strix TaxID=222440 RepID=A0A5J4VKZ8_9EUKA|nr:MAG: hypothetical protein EZS28_021155 [Streblomastix strix]
MTSNALHSLATLSCYKINIHFNQEYDQQSFALRRRCRKCLGDIQYWDDVSAHTEIVNANFVGVLVIAVGTAGGHGEEQNGEIFDGLHRISDYLSKLNQGKQYNPRFPPQPLLA